MHHSRNVIILLVGVALFPLLLPAAAPSYATLMTPVATTTTAPTAPALPPGTTPVPAAHASLAASQSTAPAAAPTVAALPMALPAAPSSNDQNITALKVRIANHLMNEESPLSDYHKSRMMHFNTKLTVLEAKKASYAAADLAKEIALLTKSLDNLFDEAPLMSAMNVTTFVNGNETTNADNLIAQNGLMSGNNIFLMINRTKTEPFLYRIILKQPIYHFNKTYQAVDDIYWQTSFGTVDRAVVATPDQLLTDGYYSENPLPAEMKAVLREPGTHTHYDKVRKTMADGSHRLYCMGNLHGWVIPVADVSGLTAGVIPTLEALGLQDKVATLPPHGDPASTRELRLVYEYQFTPAVEAVEGQETTTPETQIGVLVGSLTDPLQINGGTITKAYLGYGPDFEKFIANGEGLDTNGTMLWYTNHTEATQLYKAYHKQMIAAEEAKRVAAQQEVLQQLSHKSAKEAQDGERRIKDSDGKWFALYKNNKTTGQEELTSWFYQITKDGTYIGPRDKDGKPDFGKTNQYLPEAHRSKTLNHLVHLRHPETNADRCFITPSGYNLPDFNGFKRVSHFMGFGPDFEAYFDIGSAKINGHPYASPGYSQFIYGPDYKKGYAMRDAWIAAGYPKVPTKRGDKITKGGLATFGSGVKNLFSGFGKMLTLDFKTD